MILNELFSVKKTITLFEGGNLELPNPNDPTTPYQADEIDLKVHNRSFMVGLLDKLLNDINGAFYSKYKKPLWNPNLLQSKQFLGGSSLHFFNTDGISDKEFAKHKPKVGDIDTQCNKELEPEIRDFLTTYDHKQIGDTTLLGFSQGSEQLNALFQFQDPPIKIQIDFEFGRYDEETDMPDEWYRFSHSSEWNDIQEGIKGVFHKYIYRALTSAHSSIKHQVDVKKTKTNIKPNVRDNDLSFAVASGQGGGLTQKYEPYIHTDPETGEKQTHKDDVPYKRLIPSAQRTYIQDLDKQFYYFFGTNPEDNDKELQKSFLGTLELINKYIPDPASKQSVFTAFLELCFEPGNAQMITKNDPERDQEIKFAAIDNFVRVCKLGKLRNTAVEMGKAYIDEFKEVQSYKQEHPEEKQPRAALKRLKAASQPVNENSLSPDKKAATRRIQKMLNDKYNANLDIDGVLGPLTLKSINKFIPIAKTGLADNPNKTTAVQGRKIKENFADGRHPEDKGDAKRHGINTKASVSSLRKTAHQGGRKGQLAHWLANMKAGRAKHHESLSEAEVKAQLRKGMPHLKDLKAVDFLDLLDEIHDGNGNFKLENMPLNVKVDGFGGRFGKNADGKPFMGTSRTEPRYEPGFMAYHQKKGTQDPEILGRAKLFDDLFVEMMNAVKLVDGKLGPDFLIDKQVSCEVLFLPFATETEEGKLKFVGIHYDKLPQGVQLALVPFHVVTASTGEPVENSQEVVKELTGLGQQGSVMFIDNSLTQNESLDVTAIVPPLENIEELKSIVSDTMGKRDRASLELRKNVEAQLQPVKLALEKAIAEDPNIIGKDMLGKDYEGIVLNTRLGPVKITSAEQRAVIASKQAAQASARTERPRGEAKTAVVAIGSFIGHKGHEELFNYTINKANELGGDPYLFIGNAEGKDDPIPPAVKVQTWHKLYPEYAKNISTVQQGGQLIQKIKHELINPLPNKPPRYDNIVIMVGEDRKDLNMPQALMKAVNKFQGYEHVKVSLGVTPRGTGISGTLLRNSLKNDPPEKALAVWSNAFDVNKLGKDWIEHLMDITRKGMGIQQRTQQQPAPVAERLFNALMAPKIDESSRMSAAVKLQRAWEREQAKSTASRKRGEEYMNQIKQDVANKNQKPTAPKEVEDESIMGFLATPKLVAKKSTTSSAEMRKYFEKDKPANPEKTERGDGAKKVQQVYTRSDEAQQTAQAQQAAKALQTGILKQKQQYPDLDSAFAAGVIKEILPNGTVVVAGDNSTGKIKQLMALGGGAQFKVINDHEISIAQQEPVMQTVAEDADKKCPPATQDITLNLKNRQKAINEYGYGPLNPDLPNTKFWMRKVDEWNLDSTEEAKQSLCGNCAAFDQRADTLDCIAHGIGSDQGAEDPTIEAGDLGYCRFLKFKCASRRTCDAWVTGGPLTDKQDMAEGKEEYNRELSQKGFHFEQEIDGVTYKVSNVKGGSDNIKIHALDAKGKVIGSASFWRHQYQDGLESLGTSVDPAWQGKGIATNMYAVMRMLGVNIHPASIQSDDGKKMWDKWRKQGDAKYIKSMNAKISEGDSGAKYKVKSIGQDKRGEYYISPSTGGKVYKKAKVGDHEVPNTKEIKPKVEAMMPASNFAGSKKNKLGTAGQLKATAKHAKQGDLVGGAAESVHSPAQRAAIAIAKQKEVDEDQRLDPHCWKGYRKQGTKMKGGTRVNNCVKVSEDIENKMSNLIRLLENK
jgi:hypothetical protein